MSSTDSSTENPDWLDKLRDKSKTLGFVKFGVAPAIDSRGFTDLVKWIEAGHAAGMEYFQNRFDAYQNPNGVMPGTKSIIVLALPYPAGPVTPIPVGHGAVARYAWPGVDYHDVVHAKMKQLKRFLAECAPEVRLRGCIDTAPLMERELAELAGIGWRGKNTLLLTKDIGSYFFLASLLVDVELPYDSAHETSHCGTCTACLDACPTNAFPSPGVLDARRCISYLTIEHREEIPDELSDDISNWVFGCDVCQEVCPWNRKPTRLNRDASSSIPMKQIELYELFEIDDAEFRLRFRKSPLWRTRLRGMRRNAAIVMGNQGNRSAIPWLEKGMNLPDPMVADACRKAIQKITGNDIASASTAIDSTNSIDNRSPGE